MLSIFPRTARTRNPAQVRKEKGRGGSDSAGRHVAGHPCRHHPLRRPSGHRSYDRDRCGSPEPRPRRKGRTRRARPEEIARDKEEQIKEAEKTATWQNAHCKLLPAYYQGPEAEVPLAELVGLSADADEVRIQERCAELLPAIHLLGGWPTAKPQQDNFVVCTGFRFELTGNFAFSVRVTPESLAAGTILYGRPGNEIHSQKVSTDTAVGIGTYTPVVVRADDRCVAIGIERAGRRRAIPGRILRDGETP